MKTHTIIPLLFVLIWSCKHKNVHQLALENYIKEDLHFKQARINYQLEEFKIRALEIEFKKYYKTKYKESALINKLCIEFENSVLKTKNLDSINTLFKNLKDSILKQKLTQNKFVKKEINALPETIEHQIQKYNLLRKLKELNYTINNLELNRMVHQGGCKFNINYSSALPIRLDDSTVVLNIYSEIAKGYANNFNDKSFTILKLEDIHKNNIINRGQIRDIIESYIIETKSDTIFLDAVLKTKKETGLLVAENKSYLIVGEHKIFDNNYLDEYFDFLHNKN